MLDMRLYMLQRLSALVMAPLVIGHIILMIYAIGGGLSAEEVLGRTQGSIAWFLYYGLFVTAVSIHAAIGLRVVLSETVRLHGIALSLVSWGIGLGLMSLGFRAVHAVTAT